MDEQRKDFPRAENRGGNRAMMKRTVRLAELALAHERGIARLHTVKEFAERYKVSRRTIFRDLKLLRQIDPNLVRHDRFEGEYPAEDQDKPLPEISVPDNVNNWSDVVEAVERGASHEAQTPEAKAAITKVLSALCPQVLPKCLPEQDYETSPAAQCEHPRTNGVCS
jgi:hypothetical protein